MRGIPFYDVEITSGFWHEKQKLNRDVTIYSVYDRFLSTGRIGAFKCDWKEGQPNRPHVFWDSDVAKWMESVAYLLEKGKNDRLEATVDGIIDEIVKNQLPDGYFNICFVLFKPDQRFTDRNAHELYCAGHLIEAACAYYHATGKDKFLNAMKKYADHIERAFKIEKTAAFITPGHPEIELALVKLWQTTGERRYLELSKFFVESRGGGTEPPIGRVPRDSQDHLPAREQTTAEGHAVRACYFYAGMADIAREYGDTGLAAACRKIFDNITKKRMYITGGAGSTRHCEAYTYDYDLPNGEAYAETCAAISLAYFAARMSLLEPDSRYADTVERVIYNGFLSGLSLDGDSFFYVNPLELDPARVRYYDTYTDGRMPLTRRAKIFGCSCCPPNITRFIASIGGFMYSAGSRGGRETVYCHQYAPSEASVKLSTGAAKLTQQTDYPSDGRVAITYAGPEAALALRIPAWSRRAKISLNGEPIAEGGGIDGSIGCASDGCYTVEDGYAVVNVSGGDTVTLEFDMTPRFVYSNPAVGDNFGRVAVTRGPVVYCMEQADNGAGLKGVTLVPSGGVREENDSRTGLPALYIAAERSLLPENAPLYSETPYATEPFTARLIPYYAFANREEGEMVVWAKN